MNKVSLLVFCAALLSGCGSDDSSTDKPVSKSLMCDLSDVEFNFQDTDLEVGSLGGQIFQTSSESQCNASHLILQWSRSKVELNDLTPVIEQDQITITLPSGTALPEEESALTITPILNGEVGKSINILIVDLVGIAGPGGNVINNWQYGVDRDLLRLPVSHRDGVDYCQFDNGNVLVHDSAFETYTWQGKDIADDILYPAFEFDCTSTKENLHRPILWANSEFGQYTHTYSTINDAMYYGNVVFDMFEKYIDQRPLDKLRLRVHHGSQYMLNYGGLANWNGAYVNLNDAVYHAYGMASLDIIAHETAHAVLQKHSALKHSSELQGTYPYSTDGLTLHEAYGDMAAVVAHYELYGQLNWINGDENFFGKRRYLNKIETGPGAILSYLDYQPLSAGLYDRIGIMTYPFYDLSNQWGIEKAFELFTAAAKGCWKPDHSLLEAAVCVKEAADEKGDSVDDVVNAFRKVKLKLAAEDTFAHYEVDINQLRVQFENLSETDRKIVNSHWDFGDGETSSQTSPNHEYATSGEYMVTLTIEDNVGVKDSLTRLLSVTD